MRGRRRCVEFSVVNRSASLNGGMRLAGKSAEATMYPSPDLMWMAMWWLIELVFIAVVLWMLLTTLVDRSSRHESEEEMLKRRLVSGEIDAEEYERRRATLAKRKGAA
jgi:uncharacterized membrane protein